MESALSFAQDVIRCSLCDNAVEYHCTLCHVRLCSECTSKHLSDKSKKHEIAEFTSEKDTLKRHECPSHDSNNCEIYCRNCKIPVCSKCVVGVHRQHDFIELDDFLEEKKQDVIADLNEIESLLLPEFQKQKDIMSEETKKNTIEVITNQEDLICKAVRDFGRQLREEVSKHKKEIQEKEKENISAEKRFLESLHKAKSLLASNDTKAILGYSGIEQELRIVPHQLDNCMPVLDVKRLEEEDIASLFGTFVTNKRDTNENKNENIVGEGNFEDEPWFHGFIPREEAERLLKKDGDFLVRVSESSSKERCFVISAYREKPVHTKILPEDVVERLGRNCTLVDLVNHLKTTGEHLSLASLAVLQNPVPRIKSQLDFDKIKLDSKLEIKQMGTFQSLVQGSFGFIKVFIKKDEEDEKIVFKDLSFLRQFHHPNIVDLIGYSALRKPALLVIEYLSGGVLLGYLKKKGEIITVRKRIEMCLGVANGMAYLHLNKCIHRDLAARNCLVSEEDSRVKIFNFWMAETGDEYHISGTQRKIPVRWTSPETILSQKFTLFSDIWSFGILIWEVFSSGLLPYADMNQKETVKKVTEGYRMPSPKGTPKACYDLMLKCWEKEPTNRFQFDAVVEKLNKIIKNVK
ncbi:tyrosine-protein kinase Fer-like [Saccostrea echinata]|uniref:tyrosine-protein kinase Fer-like n=1 Tax=Saccostrea echinata TaxID=191078 RepID=UPI002A810764|nr:tyrosine-protein kinase Fer-like [Saccostrea echinata]